MIRTSRTVVAELTIASSQSVGEEFADVLRARREGVYAHLKALEEWRGTKARRKQRRARMG